MRELQLQPPPAHCVGAVNHAILLDAEGFTERRLVCNLHEGAFRHRRGPRKACIVSRQVDVPDPHIRGCDLTDASLGKLLGQPVLEGAEHALRAAPRLRRIGRDVLDAKPIERTAHLGQTLPVDRFAGLGSEKIMAAAIGVEARWQAVRREHLKQRLECRGRPFLLHQQRRVDRARRVIHCDDQIQCRLPAKPRRPRTVLVQHHAFARLALALAPMRATPLRTLH